MKHVGDITKLSGYDLPIVDVITGGSPCQDLSIAGKREGLAGERSGLFMEQIRIVKEMRQHDRASGRPVQFIRPRYMVWENVPGAFSSNGGKDFQTVLTEIVRIAEPESPDVPLFGGGGRKKWDKAGCLYDELGRWSIAWRVHDAQFWGVPQRRKRIALIADFGGLSAGEILFERKGMYRDIEPGEEAGEAVAGGAGEGVGATVYDAYQHHGWRESDTVNSLTTDRNNSVRGDTPLVCYGISSDASNAMRSDNPHSGIYQAETSRTLDNNGGNPACNQGGIAGDGYKESETMFTLNSTEQHAVAYRKTGHPRTQEEGQGWEETDKADTLNVFDNSESRTPTVVFEPRSQDGVPRVHNDGVSPTLNTIGGGSEGLIVDVKAYGETGQGYWQIGVQTLRAEGENIPSRPSNILVQDIAGTLDSNYYKGCGERQGVEREVVCIGNGQVDQLRESDKVGALNCMHEQQALMTNTVRRLTPLECERLQGFPDGWTDIGEWTDSKGKKRKTSDSARYKALGNSIALPFWFYLLRRISAQYERPATLGSLFDGVGGFPLCWERCNGARTAIWASEIEEFPIAVTKARFPE